MPKQPNVLFLFTDQQRADTMACYGNDDIQTPNLNALASRSFVFDNAYVSQPVCTPSRATILTGLYPHTSGCTVNNVPLPPAVKTIAEMVPDEYRTGYFGKWHLGDELRPQHGFEEWVSIEEHLGRVPRMASQQSIQAGVGHRVVCFGERQRHVPSQRQGVRLAKLFVALAIVLPSRDARRVNDRSDMLRAEPNRTGRLHGIPRGGALELQEVRIVVRRARELGDYIGIGAQADIEEWPRQHGARLPVR